MTTEQTTDMMTDEIRQSARAMYVRVCGAAQAEAYPSQVADLAWLMTRRTVTGMTEVKLNSPQDKTFAADKNSVRLGSVARYVAYAHCQPVAGGSIAGNQPETPAAPIAAVTAGTRTIHHELYNPNMAYSVGDVVDGQYILGSTVRGANEDNDDFYPTQVCTVRPATEAEMEAYKTAQATELEGRRARAAAESARYAGYEF